MGVMVSRAVPEGLTDTTILVCGSCTPSSLYWGRICVTLHWGSQSLKPGAARSKNPLAPPISCVFSTATACRFANSRFSHTWKLSICRTSQDLFWGNVKQYYYMLGTVISALPAQLKHFLYSGFLKCIGQWSAFDFQGSWTAGDNGS